MFECPDLDFSSFYWLALWILAHMLELFELYSLGALYEPVAAHMRMLVGGQHCCAACSVNNGSRCLHGHHLCLMREGTLVTGPC